MAPVKMAENAPSYIFRRKAKNSMFPLETKARDISIIIVEILEIPKPISNKFYPSKITRTLFYDTRIPTIILIQTTLIHQKCRKSDTFCNISLSSFSAWPLSLSRLTLLHFSWTWRRRPKDELNNPWYDFNPTQSR